MISTALNTSMIMLTMADVYSQIYRNTFEKKNLVTRVDERLTGKDSQLKIEDFLRPVAFKVKIGNSYQVVEIFRSRRSLRLTDHYPGVEPGRLTFTRGVFFVF